MEIDNEPLVEQNPFLDDVFSAVTPIGKMIRCTKNFNAGYPTFTTHLSMFELFQHTDVANDRLPADQQAQRALDMPHAKGLALYFLKALLESALTKRRRSGETITEIFNLTLEELGKQPYYSIPPLVANVRTLRVQDVKPVYDANNEIVCYKVTLQHGDVLWIIDGQHRRKALQLVFDFLDYVTTYHKYPKGSFYPSKNKEKLTMDEVNMWNSCKEMSKWCTVTLETHIGLSIEQERQLFHDLNNKVRKVEKSIALKFDNSNPVNQYVTSKLINGLFEQHEFNVIDKDEVDWEEELPSISRKQLVAVNALLFMNKSNINGALPADVSEYRQQTANQFWSNVLDISHMQEHQHKLKTTAAQPVVLKAIAKLYFDFFFGKNEDFKTEENQNKLIDGLSEFDFSHTNPAWRYYMMDESQRAEAGISSLSAYLPKDDDGKIRDLGAWDEKSQTFRFARTHNDVYPLIGDIIRWRCALPSRSK